MWVCQCNSAANSLSVVFKLSNLTPEHYRVCPLVNYLVLFLPVNRVQGSTEQSLPTSHDCLSAGKVPPFCANIPTQFPWSRIIKKSLKIFFLSQRFQYDRNVEFAYILHFFLVSLIKYTRNSTYKRGLKHFHLLVRLCVLQLVKTRRAIYVYRNNEARSRNHLCRGKATSITHSECVSVALVSPACNGRTPYCHL